MLLQECLGVIIGSPDRGQTGGLGGHSIHKVTVVSSHRRNARSNELHYFILYIAIFINSAADSQRNIVRSNERRRFSG